MDGNELAYISERLTGSGRYGIYKDGKLSAETAKRFSLFKKRYTVSIPEAGGYDTDSNFWHDEYRFAGGRPAARVTKDTLTLPVAYEIDVEEGEDDVQTSVPSCLGPRKLNSHA